MAALAVTLCGNAVHAEDATPDEITQRLLACDTITDLTQRLVCFNEIVASLKESISSMEAAPMAGAAMATAATPDAAPAADIPADTTAALTEEPPMATDTAADSSRSAAVPIPDTPPAAAPAATMAVATAAAVPAESPAEAQPPPAEPPAAPADTPPGTVDDFGRDSMKTKADEEDEEQVVEDDKPLSISATIVRSWRNHDGRFSVELDNGQIWRETQGTRVGFPKEGKSVEVFEGRFGGYRMRIEDIRKIAWVRRTM